MIISSSRSCVKKEREALRDKQNNEKFSCLFQVIRGLTGSSRWGGGERNLLKYYILGSGARIIDTRRSGAGRKLSPFWRICFTWRIYTQGANETARSHLVIYKVFIRQKSAHETLIWNLFIAWRCSFSLAFMPHQDALYIFKCWQIQ